MKYILAVLSICLCTGCVETVPGPGQPTQLVVLPLPQEVISDQVLYVNGSGFDTSVRVYFNGRMLPIDTLRSAQLTVRAPWPRGTYKVTMTRHSDTIDAGSISVVRVDPNIIEIEDGGYILYQIELVYSNGRYEWKKNTDGSFRQEAGTGRASESIGIGVMNDTIVADKWHSGYFDKSGRTLAQLSVTTDITDEYIGLPGEGPIRIRDSTTISSEDLRLSKDGEYFLATSRGNGCGLFQYFSQNLTRGTEARGVFHTDSRSSMTIKFKKSS